MSVQQQLLDYVYTSSKVYHLIIIQQGGGRETRWSDIRKPEKKLDLNSRGLGLTCDAARYKLHEPWTATPPLWASVYSCMKWGEPTMEKHYKGSGAWYPTGPKGSPQLNLWIWGNLENKVKPMVWASKCLTHRCVVSREIRVKNELNIHFLFSSSTCIFFC